MNYQELLEKYNLLVKEFDRLSEENNKLKAKLIEFQSDSKANNVDTVYEQPKSFLDDNLAGHLPFSEINNKSDSVSKIKLFMSLFKGREDVYATKWVNKDKTKSGYSPVCLNQWQSGLCGKPKISCSKCENRSYAALDEDVIEDHLRGNIVAGVYGSINLLSYGSSQESIMRIESSNIANELIKTIEGQ